MASKSKALCLLSGGLDSLLAAKIVIGLGLELVGLRFVTVFDCGRRTGDSKCSIGQELGAEAFGQAGTPSSCRQLGIDVTTTDCTEDHIETVQRPRHGYGTYLNPCIDCRIMMLQRALVHMREISAQFLVTGEVLGQRPMSQRRDAMLLTEKEAGATGLVLRPLSAKLLAPSIPERKGIVDRTRMLSISGRSRKTQIALAETLGIKDYPAPAGGCRLTEPGFAGRMKDLLEHTPLISPQDMQLLKYGRHFRLSLNSKAVVGRNESENSRIAYLAQQKDILVQPTRLPGPTTLVVGSADDADIRLACAMTASYTARDESSVELNILGGDQPGTFVVPPLPRQSLEASRILPLRQGWRRQVDGGGQPRVGLRLRTPLPAL